MQKAKDLYESAENVGQNMRPAILACTRCVQEYPIRILGLSGSRRRVIFLLTRGLSLCLNNAPKGDCAQHCVRSRLPWLRKFKIHYSILSTWPYGTQYLLCIRLPGTELIIEIFVLDDTGSSIVDLFEFPDTIILRPHNDHLFWICLDTNNGRVWKRSLGIEVNMRDNHGPFIFNQWQIMQASITARDPE